MDFRIFRTAVAAQFEYMKKHDLFRTQVEKDKLWDTYLGSFPPGSDPIYKERTEHDCNCCKQFIRAIGNVVAVIDGKLVSIWDVAAGDANYQAVADALSALVKSQPIENAFLHFEQVAGTDKNFQDTVDGVITWEHFFVNVPKQYVAPGADIASRLGDVRANHDVLARSLDELTAEAIDTVLELIAQNSLYRGEEHKFAVTTFRNLKTQYDQLPPEQRDNFVWSVLRTTPASVSKFRNSVIGSLIAELSSGTELEAAVGAFEARVAPTNYKRPTALVTKAMVEKARARIEELGLVSALERRYATINDITINNILFASRTARNVLTKNVFDEISSSVAENVPKLDKVEEVPIEKFLADILPRAESVEIMMESQHTGNLMSLIAPSDPTAAEMFKWNNKFSWSYTGELADSIKERVKQAGGNVSGDLCCRLAWYNYDDLDFHMIEPGGYELYFGNRTRLSPAGGRLDVDMNAGTGTSRSAVENIFYEKCGTMKEGVYTLQVHNFNRRETIDVGFTVEMDFKGRVTTFAYDRPVKHGETITVAKFHYSHKDGIKMIDSLTGTQASREVWGIPTQTFQPVSVMMLSPNYWDDQAVGNKHYFFIIDGCKNDGKARGFFNEFLKEELTPHRKVIEVVGSKMKTEESDKQLSGLGFSSTQRNSVLCRVKGSFTRVVRIVF